MEAIMTTTSGLDVSRWQGVIDWRAVANAQYKFAVIRSSVGDAYIDPQFAMNWNNASSAGLLLSAYHVLKPEIAAEAQINNLFAALANRKTDLPLVLDIELTGGLTAAQITASIRSCLQLIEQRSGRKPIIYTARWFWDPNVQAAADWADYDLWVASYGVSTPTLPRDWAAWKFWQYTDKGQVPGIGTAVDLNWFNGSIDDLLAYAQHAPAPINAGQKMIVAVQTLNVRNGPGANYDVISTLQANDALTVNLIDGTDVWVQFDQGKWAALSYHGTRFGNIELRAMPNAGLQMRVTASTLNVRSQPDVTSNIVGLLRQGEVVAALNIDGGDAWGQFAAGKWAAITFRGDRFMNFA
jgi:lysozyme